MYSACHDFGSNLSNFLDHCLDPIIPQHGHYTGKADFLEGRTLFSSIQFVGRPGLHNLFNELAMLFSACYTRLKALPPTFTDEQRSNWQQAECYTTSISLSHPTRSHLMRKSANSTSLTVRTYRRMILTQEHCWEPHLQLLDSSSDDSKRAVAISPLLSHVLSFYHALLQAVRRWLLVFSGYLQILVLSTQTSLNWPHIY